MPRNRYIPLIRKRERARIAHQQKELTKLAQELHREATAPAVQPGLMPFIDDVKDHRRVRLERKQLYKPRRGK